MGGWKKYVNLHKKRQRYAEGLFLAEGVRLCREALLSEWPIEAILTTEEFQAGPQWTEFYDAAQHRNLPAYKIGENAFRKLADAESPQGIVMVVKMPSFSPGKVFSPKSKLVLVLDSVRDPGNLGTLIRSADWFGASAVLLSADCVDPYNPKVVRSSMGSLFHLPVYVSQDLEKDLTELKKRGFGLFATSLQARQSLEKTRFHAPVALLLGGEAQGVSPKLLRLANRQIKIWRYGKAESLNVAIAGSIFLNAIAAQLNQTRKRKG